MEIGSEQLGVGRKLDHRPVLLVGLHHLAVLLELTLAELHPLHLPFADRLGGVIDRQSVDRFLAHPVQSHCLLEGVAVVFGARVDDRNALHQLAQGDAPAVVADPASLVGHFDLDLPAVPHREFIDGIIDRLLQQDVNAVLDMRSVAQPANVHARPQPDVLRGGEGFDARFSVCLGHELIDGTGKGKTHSIGNPDMKKKLYIVLGVILGVVLVVYLVLIFFVGSLVTTAVNKYGPQLAKTNVHLTEAHISPLSGEGTLDKLIVANPAGWSQNNAFSLKSIHVAVEPSTIFSDHIVIKEIKIDSPEILYETRVLTSNLGDIVKGLQHDQTRGTADAKTKTGTTIKFEVDHLLVQGGTIKLSIAGAAAVPLTMPTIDLHDLGKDGGITSTQLATLITETMLKTVVQSAAGAANKIVPRRSLEKRPGPVQAVRMKVTYYLEIISSWCHWAEPSWDALKAQYAGRVEFDWQIALMKPEDFPTSRAQADWFYNRSGGTVMRSAYKLNSGWFDAQLKGDYRAPNLVAEAARGLGATDDTVRRALSAAGVLEGRKIGSLDEAVKIATAAGKLSPKKLKAAAQSAAVAARVNASTAKFHSYQISQRPAFILEDAIGDKAVFSGLVRFEPLAATIDAMLSDTAAYAAHAAHHGKVPQGT